MVEDRRPRNRWEDSALAGDRTGGQEDGKGSSSPDRKSSGDEKSAGGVPGGDAERPKDIPPQGWFQILKRGMAEASADQVPLLAAGVAFFAFLAIFPALIAIVSLYGFFADPQQIADQVNSLSGALPDDVRTLLTEQITTLTAQKSTLGIGAIVSILLALFSASAGMQNLMVAVNVAYDEEDKRGAVKKRLLALALTLAATVFMLIVLGLVAVLPPLLEGLLGSGGFAYWLLLIGRWVLLAVVVAVALAVLYRVAPDRDAPKIRWVQIGAVIATVLWLIASAGFSLYVSVLGNYAKTYGALAGIVVLLFWLWITAYAILLGAEINAETEQQTVKDTTKGPEQPIGQRDAVKADSTPT
jgi:membrane protein